MGRFGPERELAVARETSRLAGGGRSVFRAQAKRGWVSLSLTVDLTRIGTEAKIARAQDLSIPHRVILARMQTDASFYVRADRFKGLWAVERGGYRINWRPGYPGYKGYDVAEALPQRVRLKSHRPYHPVPNKEARAWALRVDASYVARGYVPGERSR